MADVTRSGRCFCEAVQLAITGEPAVMTYCHCDSCRRWAGGPVHAGCLFPAENVQVIKGSDQLTTFLRTKDTGTHRKFCEICGAPVLKYHPFIEMIDIPAVSIQDLIFRPKLHTHYPERILSIKDGLPKYKDFDPAVGGTGETVPE